MSKWRNIQESVVTRAVIGVIFGLLVDGLLHGWNLSALARFWRFSEDAERVFTLLTVFAAFSLSILLELKQLPGSFRGLREEMFGASDAAREQPLLNSILRNVIDELQVRLNNLENYKYIDMEGTIPQLSVETMNRVIHSAFATFVADSRERVYEDDAGKAYMAAWYARAKALPNRVHRLFIVESKNLTDEAIKLIEQNIEKGVVVSVIERTSAESLRQGCELDFGLFDDTCLMTVEPIGQQRNRLSIFVKGRGALNQTEIDMYKAFQKRLTSPQYSKSGMDFLREFGRPINKTFWDTKMTKTAEHKPLRPPHGLSDIDAARMVNLVLARPGSPKEFRVAILGLTPQLQEICEKEKRIVHYEFIDQTPVSVQDLKAGKHAAPIESSWLDYDGKHTYDLIVGDEALNNLSLSQYPRFFRAMQKSLRPGGFLILRTMARYDQTARGFTSAKVADFLQRIKSPPAGDNDLERAVRILAYLHSTEIAFDEASSMISTQRYNKLLEGWIKESKITQVEATPYWFPDSENQNINLSSPTIEQLASQCNLPVLPGEFYFARTNFQDVDPSYCGSDHLLSSFYRITPFELRTAVAEGTVVHSIQEFGR